MLQLVDNGSRYDRLCSGELDGTDLCLVVTCDSDETHQEEIRVHRCFVRSCGLFETCLEERQVKFQEAVQGTIQIQVPLLPRHQLDCALENLLRWCYDGKCTVQSASDIIGLYKLADYVQCEDLCQKLMGNMKFLRSGSEFAALVDEGLDLHDPQSLVVVTGLLKALPLGINDRSELETWLDYGSSEMFRALVALYQFLQGKDSEGDMEETKEAILNVLGEYFAEMNKSDRSLIPPEANALSRMRPGEIIEAGKSSRPAKTNKRAKISRAPHSPPTHSPTPSQKILTLQLQIELVKMLTEAEAQKERIDYIKRRDAQIMEETKTQGKEADAAKALADAAKGRNELGMKQQENKMLIYKEDGAYFEKLEANAKKNAKKEPEVQEGTPMKEDVGVNEFFFLGSNESGAMEIYLVNIVGGVEAGVDENGYCVIRGVQGGRNHNVLKPNVHKSTQLFGSKEAAQLAFDKFNKKE